jgi:hypothetical protein
VGVQAFQGNVERYLGQGGLANGLVALVLVPNAPGTATSGLADEGGGFTPSRVPIVTRTGRHVTVSAQTVNLFGAEQVLHRQTPSGAGVVRSASQITFYLGSAALDRLAGIELKVFARSPASGGRRAGARSWPAIPNARAREVATLSVDQSELSYTSPSPTRPSSSRTTSSPR